MEYHVHNKVQQYRLKADMTQEALAQKTNVSRQTVIAIEKGNYAPSVALALKIASVFRVSVEDIFSLHYEK